jgi:hypothetical protein
VRARNIEQVGGFLGGQFCVDRYDLDGVAVGQSGQYLRQQAERRRRELDFMRPVLGVENLDVLGIDLRAQVGGKARWPRTAGSTSLVAGRDMVAADGVMAGSGKYLSGHVIRNKRKSQ